MKYLKKLLFVCFIAAFTFTMLSGNVWAVTKCADVTVPDDLVTIVSSVVKLIKIGVPIILAVLGMIDLGKAVATQKEEEIKKGQKTLLSRCIAAGLVFFVVSIVQLLFNIVSGGNASDTESRSMWNCISDFLNGPGTISGSSSNNHS